MIQWYTWKALMINKIIIAFSILNIFICVGFIKTALTADCSISAAFMFASMLVFGQTHNTQIYLVWINIKWAAVSKKRILELAYSYEWRSLSFNASMA